MSAESKFSFRAWSNILPTKPPEALIEGILLRGRLGVIFAKPDHGKTFVGAWHVPFSRRLASFLRVEPS